MVCIFYLKVMGFIIMQRIKSPGIRMVQILLEDWTMFYVKNTITATFLYLIIHSTADPS